MKDNIIYLPLNIAWKMRAKYAYPDDMSSKRTDEAMQRLEDGMKEGRFDPIPTTMNELEQGILSEGKHRLIIAKKLGIRKIPIDIINEENNTIVDNNINDIKKGLYGEYIETNDDGTFLVQDKVLSKTLKIIADNVLWCKSGMPEQYCKWFEAIPIISIKDSRYEQKYFENRTQMPIIDEIFKSPDYFYSAKSKVAEIKYMTPIEYMVEVAKGFNSTLERQRQQVNIETIKKYATNMLKGDLFPLINITYYKDGFIDQEGRHRAMAVQHLIDNDKIPSDTLIPVVVVTEV